MSNSFEEIKTIRKDGTDLIIEQNFRSVVEDGKIIGFTGIIKDITDRKRAEEERNYRQKLKGVLELAGAVCHEINQPLQVIFGYTELLSMELGEDSPIYEKINQIYKESTNIAQITNKLTQITKYETRDYLNKKIIDIEKASEENSLSDDDSQSP